MQTSTAVTLTEAKGRVAALLREAINHHRHCAAARSSVASAQEVAMWQGWQTGIRLNAMKAMIGSGDWVDWIELNFCRPEKVSLRTAQVYMKIDSDNAELRDKAKTQRVAPTAVDFQLLKELKFDTVRKYAIGFVPEKVKPESPGNVKFPRLVHHLKIINQIHHWRRRREVGHIEKDVEEEQRDFRPEIYWLIAELLADELVTLPDGRRALILGKDFTDLYGDDE